MIKNFSTENHQLNSLKYKELKKVLTKVIIK